MLRETESFYKKIHFLADLFLTITALYLSLFIFVGEQNLTESAIQKLLLLILPIWSFFFLTDQKAYKYSQLSISGILKKLLPPFLKSSALLIFLLYLSSSPSQNFKTLILFFGFDLLLLSAIRIIIKFTLMINYSKGNHVQNILVVGTGSLAQDFIRKAKENKDWKVKILGLLDWDKAQRGKLVSGIQVIGTLEGLPQIIKNNHIDYIVYAVPKRFLNLIEESISTCEKMGVSACVLADYFPIKFNHKKLLTFEETPFIFFSPAPKKTEAVLIKEIFDRVIAFILIILFSPLMLLTAILVKKSSKGTVLFKQQRVGLNGKKFILYKFRTMVENAEELKKSLQDKNEMEGPAFKIKEDPRIIRIGKFMRKTSLDELPQLFNVLAGDMSLVGPRPPLPQEVSNYDMWHRKRLCMKPGLTCLWQVNGRNSINFDKWMKLDLEYINNWSLFLDLKILLKTIPAVLSMSGV
ncbi:MAG: sugar transferase [candidate division Zixibacteria bacterium]|nr:sugar transferase [candidate division Zixibacteria bacterium]